MASQYERPDLPDETRWMDCATARAKWQLNSEKAVQKYCRENWNKIGAYQDRKRGPWHIPETACPPLTEEDLRDFLIIVLKHQNSKHEHFPVDPTRAVWCFTLLEQRGYAIAFNRNERIDADNLLVTDPRGWALISSQGSSFDLKAFTGQYLPATIQVTLDVTLFLLQSGVLS